MYDWGTCISCSSKWVYARKRGRGTARIQRVKSSKNRLLRIRQKDGAPQPCPSRTPGGIPGGSASCARSAVRNALRRTAGTTCMPSQQRDDYIQSMTRGVNLCLQPAKAINACGDQSTLKFQSNVKNQTR